MNYKFFYLLICLSITSKLICIGEENNDKGAWAYIKSWLEPSVEQKLFEAQAAHKLRIMDAQQTLYACLSDNKEKEKNEQGMPLACEEAMNDFAAAAGFGALNKIKAAYTKTRKVSNVSHNN